MRNGQHASGFAGGFKSLALIAGMGLIAAAAVFWRTTQVAVADQTSAPAQPSITTPTTMVQVRLLDDKGRPGPLTSVPRVVKTDDEWRKQLTPEQFKITRGKGTERAFCGAFFDNHKPGVYLCVCCDLPLFTSETKFDSGTGWPSFFSPFAPENVASDTDSTFGMERTEITCARCGAHLGHVFDDGPKPTGLRYCMNSAALVFHENKNLTDATKK